MRDYVVFISEEALASAPHSRPQRAAGMRFIRSLADNPNTVGYFAEKDDASRIVQVKVASRHAVIFFGGPRRFRDQSYPYQISRQMMNSRLK